MKYYFEGNLIQKATLSFATSFWERKEIKNQTINFFNFCDANSDNYETKDEWSKLTKDIIDEFWNVNKFLVPQHLKIELMHSMKMIAAILYNWYQYINHKYGETINYTEKIFWTSFGNVDEVITLKFLFNNPNFEVIKTYNLACECALEEYINKLWNKMPNDLRDNYYNDKVYKNFEQHILAYWKYCKNDKLSNLIRYLKTNNNDLHYQEVFNHIYNNLLKCKILNGDKTGVVVFINRITLYCEDTYSFKFKRRQFPVTLAFAMTINKAQGQTFQKIGVDLTKDIFTHGQLYVAFSRVRSWETLNIYLGNQRNNNVVKNYVYQELYR